jgi:hypothetical protein
METEPTSLNAPAKRKPFFFVIQSGLITLAATLAGVYWMNRNAEDFSIMGWYWWYVIPVGAIIVGTLAGSGFGIASWFTGVKISRGLLVVVLLLQAAGYVTAEYIEYRDVRQAFVDEGYDEAEMPSFVEYYDFKARSFAWKAKNSKEFGEPLGAMGYVFVLLGAAGFILSGLIAPVVLRAMPYCENCQRYMSTKSLGMLPASVAVRKIPKGDAAAQQAYEQEQAAAGEASDAAVQRLVNAATTNNAQAFKQELAAAGPLKEVGKLPVRVEVSMVYCKSCESGYVQPTLLAGQGDQVSKTSLGQTPVSAEFVRQM